MKKYIYLSVLLVRNTDGGGFFSCRFREMVNTFFSSGHSWHCRSGPQKPFPPPLRQSLAEAKTEENPQRIQTIHNCSPRFSFPTKQAFSLKVYAPNTPKPKHYKHKRQLFKNQKVKRWKNSHQKTKKKKYKKTFGGGDKLLKRDLQTGWLPTAENPAPHPFRSASASS